MRVHRRPATCPGSTAWRPAAPASTETASGPAPPDHGHQRQRRRVIFTFDGDAAGQRTALRCVQPGGEVRHQTFVAVQPDGLDPATCGSSRRGRGARPHRQARPAVRVRHQSALAARPGHHRASSPPLTRRADRRADRDRAPGQVRGELDHWLGLMDERFVLAGPPARGWRPWCRTRRPGPFCRAMTRGVRTASRAGRAAGQTLRPVGPVLQVERGHPAGGAVVEAVRQFERSARTRCRQSRCTPRWRGWSPPAAARSRRPGQGLGGRADEQPDDRARAFNHRLAVEQLQVVSDRTSSRYGARRSRELAARRSAKHQGEAGGRTEEDDQPSVQQDVRRPGRARATPEVAAGTGDRWCDEVTRFYAVATRLNIWSKPCGGSPEPVLVPQTPREPDHGLTRHRSHRKLMTSWRLGAHGAS